VSIGSILVNFFGLPEIAGLDETDASTFLSFYWGGTMIGRFLGAISLSNIASNKKYGLMIIVAIVAFMIIYGVTYLNTGVSFQEISPFLIFVVLNLLAFRLGNSNPQRTLAIFAGIAMLLLVLVLITSGKVAFWSVIAIGLFNSIMWSNVFTLSINGLGKYTSQASSLLVMAILGGALVPVIQGALADAIGLQMSFALPILCYAYLMYYGISGYKPKQLTQQNISQEE
jgi:FHS family L-fucose permease-like MFS transporter